jgi:diguanylate cyclase (GGDEF)-like protein
MARRTSLPASIGHTTRSPLLFPLVYAASLSLVALSAVALAVLGREHVAQAATQVAVEADQAVARNVVRAAITADELAAGAITDDRRPAVVAVLAQATTDNRYIDAVLLTPSGAVVAASEIGGRGSPEAVTAASAGGTTAAIAPSSADGPAILAENIPIARPSGVVAFVLQIRRDATPILASADAAWWDVLGVAGAAAVVLVGVLHVIFRAANGRLRLHQDLLLESRRRDPLTGLLNHGAVVAALTNEIEAARPTGASIGIAIIDLDNFQLLNDVHGSELGDKALLAVKAALEREAQSWSVLGRFGPDEFLVIAPGDRARELPAALARVESHLEATWLEPPDSERLPVSVSAGIAYFPFHAAQVTELMSTATIALGEAKASGGHQVAIANAWTSEPRAASTFDILQGLVLAIDRKDRYTKMHSEDVATYALFLADRLELPEDERATLRRSALLHDIGKIGVPDDILRKPGRLTPREMDILKQHVALGDLIVRDLPDIESVRAGVRFHHERWDGMGYLLGLSGDKIPLVARILGVADAFSAMTTTRPYRKALTVEAALDELRSVAGAQLDPGLVAAFVLGMESDPEAPLPGDRGRATHLWTGASRAA